MLFVSFQGNCNTSQSANHGQLNACHTKPKLKAFPYFFSLISIFKPQTQEIYWFCTDILLISKKQIGPTHPFSKAFSTWKKQHCGQTWLKLLFLWENMNHSFWNILNLTSPFRWHKASPESSKKVQVGWACLTILNQQL